jgi:hypothetical protein
MTTHTWIGGNGAWTTGADWTGAASPQRGDNVLLTAGRVTFDAGGTLDAITMELGAAAGAPGGAAEFVVATSELGADFDILSAGTFQDGILLAEGIVGFSGVLEASSHLGTLQIDTQASGTEAGYFVLRDGSVLTVSGGDTVVLNCSLTNNSRIAVDSGGVFVLNGTVSEADAATDIGSSGTLLGSGTVDLGLFSSLTLDQSAPATIDVAFTDVGGRLILGSATAFAGTIEGFASGDIINILNLSVATGAVVAGGVLTVFDGAAPAATLHVAGMPDGTLAVTAESTGFYPAATEPRLDYLIAADARAVNAPAVNAETLADGAHITGAGITIGIISNSFNLDAVANADAAAGFLPATVDVLWDGLAGDDDEGRAMAELIHQIAPGAALDFASGDRGTGSFASAIKSLATAGCNIIVDDLSYTQEPFLGTAGPIDAAISAAVADGVCYFTSAGNFGDAAYAGTFDAASVTLPNGTTQQGQLFATGAGYQTLTLYGGVTSTISLQWAGGTIGVAPGFQLELFSTSGSIATASTVVSDALAAEIALTYTPSATAQYELAIVGSVPTGADFKYIIFGSAGGGSAVPGSIDAPDAGNTGAIFGHAMLPGVNTVGAVNYPDTPAFGSNAPAVESYSSTGSDAAKPDFVAPVNAGTSVGGISPFDGTSAASANAAAVAALVLQADPTLSPAELTQILEDSAVSLGEPNTLQGAGLIQADSAVQLALSLACFAEGTRILTDRGAMPVEALCIGERVRTASGALRPVVWIGRRAIDVRRHPRPQDVWPVRIRAHAFAEGQPARDLLLSPDHAVAVDGALVPVRYLRNGATIAQEPVDAVVYWHVELPSHEVLLAEGLPAESYLDTGNRAGFADGQGEDDAAAALRIWAERGCLRLLRDGPELHRLHARLRARARRLGYRKARAPGLHVLADGAVLPRGPAGYALPPGTRAVHLRSRHWVPAEHDPRCADHRTLGVAVGGIVLDGAPAPLDDSRLRAGWHDPEPAWRWTGGDAELDVRGVRRLSLALAMTGRYWCGAPWRG